MSWLKRMVVASALVAGTASAAPTLGDGTTALARIDRASAEGRIDIATHALLGLRLVSDPKSLPIEFRPAAEEPKVRCGTLLARRAFRLSKAGAFNAAQSAEYAVLGGRPSMPNNITVSVNAAVVARVHYPNTVTLAVAQDIADFLQQSWTAEFLTMGWRVPPPDVGATTSDPGVELDFYLDPNKFGAYTQPIQEDTCPDNWACSASFIVLEPGVPNVETYVAHELNHASQFAYDYAEGDFIYEASATWMEDKVFDSVNDYSFFIADFQQAPDTTLSFATYTDTYMYGGAVFFHYMSDLYDAGGTTAVRDVWENSIGNSDWFAGTMDVLGPEGFADIADVYREFAGIRMLTGPRDDGTIEEGNVMTAINIEESYTFDDLGSGSTNNAPMGMGANYITVSGGAADDSVTLTIDGAAAEGPWGITTVAMPAAGAAEITVFVDEDADGTVEATIQNVGTFNEVAFAITNTANAGEGVDDTFGQGIDETRHDFSWSFGGGGSEPTSCGCALPAGRRSPNTVSVIGAFLVAAFSIVLRRR